MKKLLVVLLALGLLAGFSMTASAQTAVKFSGGYYVVGVYEDNASFKSSGSNSRAFFYQRARLQTVFGIAEGLSFTTRIDALEKQWGNTNWRRDLEDKSNSRRADATSQNVQENFEFEHAYVTFTTALGKFDIGYQPADVWGTQFADNESSRPRVKFTTQLGPFVLLGVFEKVFENDSSRAGISSGGSSTGFPIPAAGYTDADIDNYMLAGIYNFKGGSAGLLYKYTHSAAVKPAPIALRQRVNSLLPYFKATIGSLYMEGEAVYIWGKQKEYETPAPAGVLPVPRVDQDREGWGAYLMAKLNLGPAYAGASYMFSSGDDGKDWATKSKRTDGPTSIDYNPALILANDDLQIWKAGSGNGNVANGAWTNSDKTNMHMMTLFGGFNPTPKLNVQATLIYATADKEANWDSVNAPYAWKPGVVSNKYGTEFDITATYKLYENLSYMIGAGYLWTGDYYKGMSATNKVGDDYLLMNKLTLSF